MRLTGLITHGVVEVAMSDIEFDIALDNDLSRILLLCLHHKNKKAMQNFIDKLIYLRTWGRQPNDDKVDMAPKWRVMLRRDFGVSSNCILFFIENCRYIMSFNRYDNWLPVMHGGLVLDEGEGTFTVHT